MDCHGVSKQKGALNHHRRPIANHPATHDEVECANIVNGKHCGAIVDVGEGLECDALSTKLRRESALEKSCGVLDSWPSAGRWLEQPNDGHFLLVFDWL